MLYSDRSACCVALPGGQVEVQLRSQVACTHWVTLRCFWQCCPTAAARTHSLLEIFDNGLARLRCCSSILKVNVGVNRQLEHKLSMHALGLLLGNRRWLPT